MPNSSRGMSAHGERRACRAYRCWQRQVWLRQQECAPKQAPEWEQDCRRAHRGLLAPSRRGDLTTDDMMDDGWKDEGATDRATYSRGG